MSHEVDPVVQSALKRLHNRFAANEAERASHLEVGPPDTVLSFSDFAQHYFSDETLAPRQQMDDKLQFLGDVLHRVSKEMVWVPKGATPYPISLEMSVENLIPILNRKDLYKSSSGSVHVDNYQTLDPKSGEFTQVMRRIGGPSFQLFVNCELDYFQRILRNKLKETNQLKKANRRKYHLLRDSQVYEMSDRMSVPVLADERNNSVEKVPLLIVERGKSLLQAPYLIIRLAVDTQDDHPKVREYSATRDLLKFVIHQNYSPSVENAINWNRPKARLRFEDGPNVHIADEHMKLLHSSMIFDSHKRYDVMDVAERIAERHRNFEHKFPGAFNSSFYFLNMAKLITKMISQAVIAGSSFQDKRVFSGTTEFELKTMVQELESRRNFSMNALVWIGIDIWQELDEIAYELSSAAKYDPKTFWTYFENLGLKSIFPQAKRSSHPGYKDDSFSLFPELSLYADHRVGKEYKQSHAYFMNICLALALFAEDIGEEPYGAVIVKNGQIIAAAHNEIKKHHQDQTRHAEIIAIERAKRILETDTLEGCIINTTASPCGQCAYNIRVNPGIRRVYIGVESAMGGEELQSPILTEQGTPFGPPPDVTLLDIIELKRKFYSLYIEKKGWQTQFPKLNEESRYTIIP